MSLFSRIARCFARKPTPAAVALTPNMRFMVDRRTRITSDHADGRTVMHLGAGRVWAINSVGSEVWQGLADGRTTREIVDDLTLRYPVPAERLEHDVTLFLRRLVDLQLIRLLEG